MFINIILLIIGFILLIKGADIFVDGASAIALLLKIPPIIIGLTIVAFGTSAPEAAVSIVAALENSSAISISNVIGSNIFNVLAVLGINGLICSLPISRQVIRKDLPILCLSTGLTLLFMIDGKFTRIEGLIFLLCIVLYVIMLIRYSLANSVEKEDEEKPMSLSKAILFSIIGIAGIIIGGQLTVDSAKAIALDLGMSEKLVGLTIVSIGTSLPELVTGIVAARKHETDISIGNVVGSCLFNLLFILGISSSIFPYSFEMVLYIDAIIMTAVIILLYVIALVFKKVDKKQAILFIILFIIYMIYIIYRN